MPTADILARRHTWTEGSPCVHSRPTPFSPGDPIMAAQVKRVPLDGSHREAVSGSRKIGPAQPDQHIEVTIRLRHRAAISAKVRSEATNPLSHKSRRYLSREEYAANHGASPEDIAKIAAFAHAHDLSVVRSSAARRSVWLGGTVDQFSKA